MGGEGRRAKRKALTFNSYAGVPWGWQMAGGVSTIPPPAAKKRKDPETKVDPVILLNFVTEVDM